MEVAQGKDSNDSINRSGREDSVNTETQLTFRFRVCNEAQVLSASVTLVNMFSFRLHVIIISRF